MTIETFQETFRCLICWLDFEEGVGHRVDERIKHIFCQACLEIWRTRNNNCPTCRIPLERRIQIYSPEAVRDHPPPENLNLPPIPFYEQQAIVDNGRVENTICRVIQMISMSLLGWVALFFVYNYLRRHFSNSIG